ncbi:hypothetical protein L861_05320 [Litchfieldella anticariensis FP35 = DSM 16096]|uniref:Uncharacterized protein n=1 Tax=Litchfieldella anticariensis (strain DSM 16096 / CECT 5854 / CIP 108499 / LMG 22089 / FP35) TaxID=1121939 RepID=S2L9U1_LITA3|nr:hypothetical protein L861_05320 [Halomonas anticariensis FP35 = DSM 16096]
MAVNSEAMLVVRIASEHRLAVRVWAGHAMEKDGGAILTSFS